MTYDLNQIRTANMPTDRSSDLSFDPDIEPSLAQQQFAKETDVNHILKSNAFIPADVSQMRFADVSEIADYQESLNIVMKAQDSFSGLTAEIRAFFDNDPANMVAYLSDPQNAQEAQEMGLPVSTASTPAEKAEPIATPSKEA
ncbi:MAG: internal scaffolding protein [Microvirus sp.]|nr:MAG: internal scaffolding protein [Microvirus sp.]